MASSLRSSLVWQYSTGFYVTTDNVDAKTDYGAGALDGSSILHTGGDRVYLPFTTVGGAPIVNQTVWMAAGRDDNTPSNPSQPDASRGKATATLPDTSVPDKITGFPYGCQQVVPVGICRGGEDVPGSLYFLVELAATPFGPVPNVTPVDPPPMTFKGATCYGGSYNVAPYFETDGTPAQMQFLNNETFIFKFTVDNIRNTELVPGTYTGFASYDAIFQGWEFNTQTRGVAAIFSNGTAHTSTPGFYPLQPGNNTLAITNVGGKLRASLNGYVPLPSIDANSISSAGINGLAGAKFRFYWSIGALCSCVKLHRGMTDDELVARSTPTPLSYTNNPWAPDPDLIVDPTCQWYLDLTSYAGGAINSIGGPAGVGAAWTKVGGVGSKSWTINWHRSPKDLLHWAPGSVYDQNHRVAVPEMAMFRGTCPNMEDFNNIALAIAIEDEDNSDESGCSILANGVAVLNLTAPDVFAVGEQFAQRFVNPNDATWWSRIATDGGPFTFDFLQADMLWRQGTFSSGLKISAIGIPTTVTLEPETTARLMIAFMDGTAFGGHSSFILASAGDGGRISATSGAGAVAYMRNDYPGKIIAHTDAVGCMYLANQWGSGSIVPWARWLYGQRTTGTPATHEYLIATGYDDWAYGANLYRQTRDVSIAQWGALLDMLHSLDPGARIMIAPPPQSNIYAEVDVFGASLGSYVTAIQGLTSGRPWLTLLDFTIPNAVTYNGLIHPGAATPINLANVLLLAANVKAAVGY